jgi:hypothetical protein
MEEGERQRPATDHPKSKQRSRGFGEINSYHACDLCGPNQDQNRDTNVNYNYKDQERIIAVEPIKSFTVNLFKDLISSSFAA